MSLNTIQLCRVIGSLNLMCCRSWKEGKFIILDDSFEHEVWQEGSSIRVILIVDIWHPDLDENQKRTLSPI